MEYAKISSDIIATQAGYAACRLGFDDHRRQALRAIREWRSNVGSEVHAWDLPKISNPYFASEVLMTAAYVLGCAASENTPEPEFSPDSVINDLLKLYWRNGRDDQAALYSER